jgi:hypothetical protein
MKLFAHFLYCVAMLFLSMADYFATEAKANKVGNSYSKLLESSRREVAQPAILNVSRRPSRAIRAPHRRFKTSGGGPHYEI